MTDTYTKCPNCKATLKKGVFGSNELVEPIKTEFANYFLEKDAEAYCAKCYAEAEPKANSNWKFESSSLHKEFEDLLQHIPVVTLQSPQDWKYKVIRMVTAQSVTGTGIITEFASSFTDLFGMQSKKYNAKIRAGETICAAQLRMEALDLGANAVIATDIDYAEVGGDKGMLMVCMSGTAVRLENAEILGSGKIEKLRDLSYVNNKLKEIEKFEKLVPYY